MNYILLPLHNKSKSIHFIYSPKLWIQNFISYLEINNKPLYDTIINYLHILKISIFVIVLIICFNCIGYYCISKNDVDRLYEETGIDCLSYLIVTLVGIGICFALFGMYCAIYSSIILMIQFILQIYDTIFSIISALRAYNNNLVNKKSDVAADSADV
jgi:hypothetical protein